MILSLLLEPNSEIIDLFKLESKLKVFPPKKSTLLQPSDLIIDKSTPSSEVPVIIPRETKFLVDIIIINKI